MGSASALGASDGGAAKSWLEDEEAWGEVVARTDELVGVLENYGALAEGVGERWRGKARSAVRSVMGKARTAWEGSEGWKVLERLAEGLA
ncbi:Putative band 7 family protein [Verticillium dahliae VDG2]|nr:Putative band 7 family protein [Verticillium dahliae VDG2]